MEGLMELILSIPPIYIIGIIGIVLGLWLIRQIGKIIKTVITLGFLALGIFKLLMYFQVLL